MSYRKNDGFTRVRSIRINEYAKRTSAVFTPVRLQSEASACCFSTNKFEAIATDLSPEELLDQVEAAAKDAADRLVAKNPRGKVTFPDALRRLTYRRVVPSATVMNCSITITLFRKVITLVFTSLFSTAGYNY